VALCRLLLRKPDMLLLDEPTNHLDAESVAWLERFLAGVPRHRRRRHPRSLLPRQRRRLDPRARPRPGHPVGGQLLRPGWSRSRSAWSRRRSRERAASARRSAASSSGSACRPGPPGQEQGAHQRLRGAARRGGQREKSRRDRRDLIPPGPRLGDLVIEANISKGFGDRLLIDNLNFKPAAGGIVGVIGPNGAGKTTLFRMITGQEKPDAARSSVGETVKLGYVDQSRDALDGQQDGVGGDLRRPRRDRSSASARCRRAYVGAFNFKGADQQKKVGQLSGGERNRVHLAKMLKSGGNVLLLDEPTNDLDVDTLRALEDGAARLRRLRRRDQPRSLVPRPHRDPHPGLRGRQPGRSGSRATTRTTRPTSQRRLGADADQPHRIKYPLVR
jgi:sulfate-transporting ATPase